MSDTESFESVIDMLGEWIADGPYGIYGHNRLIDAHDREIRDVSKQQYHRGYIDGQHSMDAEHRAVAMRLRALPLDGGSHENLSQIARAVYHTDWGWTQGACMSLRDELVRLMGGVSDENVHVGGLRCDDGCMGDVSNGEDTGRAHDSPSNRDRNHMAVCECVDTAIGDSDDTCDSQYRGACAAGDGRDSGEQEEVSDDGADCDILGPDARGHTTGRDFHELGVTDGRVAYDSAGDTGGSYRGLSVHMDGLVSYDVLDNERRKAVCELRKCELGYTLEWDNIYEIFDALGVDYVGMAMAEVYESLRDRLIHLLGGDQPSGIDVLRAMDGDGTCPNDVPTSSITDELREWVKSLYTPNSDELKLEGLRIADRIDEQFDRMQETIDEMVVDQGSWKTTVDMLKAKADKLERQRDELRAELDKLHGHSRTCPESGDGVSESAPSASITDELREWASDRHCKGMSHTDVLNIGLIADRIDARHYLTSVVAEASTSDAWIAMSEYDKLREERDELQEKLDEAQNELQRGKWEYCETCEAGDRCDELQEKLDSAEDALNRAAGRWAKADAECRELRDELNKANGENKGLRLSIDEQKEAIAQRKKTIGKLTRDNAKVWKTVHELQEKLDEYNSTHVELPRDANGEVFRLGCTVRMVERHPEVLLTVHSMTLCDDGEWLLMARDDEEEYFCNHSASEFEVFEKPQDTAESIVRDLSIGAVTEGEAIKRIEALNG